MRPSVNSRVRVRFTLRAVSVSILSAAAAVCIVGCPPEPGTMVDIGGYSLQCYELGEGDVTVIFENGLSDSFCVWCSVQSEVSNVARTLSYDRAGVASSDEGVNPRTGLQVVSDLHALLTNLGIPGPYVLVGHSMGGLYVRLFANQYPDEVAGMVLVDADHEDLDIREALILSPMALAITLTMDVLDADFLGSTGGPGEYFNKETTFNQVRENREIPEIPLAVLHAPDADKLYPGQPESPDQIAWDNLKLELQEDMAALSPNSTITPVPDCSHEIQKEKPEYVIDAINWVLGEIAAGK